MRKNAIILRTSWVYSEYGNNFVDTILKLLKSNTSLNVVSDQIGSPTYALDLAKVIIKIIGSNQFFENEKTSSIYHYSNDGECSWFDFAREIANISKISKPIIPVKSDDFPSVALRPKYTVLVKKKIYQDYDLQINFWKDSLNKCIKNIENLSAEINN